MITITIEDPESELYATTETKRPESADEWLSLLRFVIHSLGAPDELVVEG